MNACAIKPNLPFVTGRELKRTPATEENRRMVQFLDNHNFSFSVNESKELECLVTPKK